MFVRIINLNVIETFELNDYASHKCVYLAAQYN